MPINSQIPLAFRGPQIESPLAQYGQMVQLRALMQQQEMQKAKLAEEQRRVGLEEQFRSGLRPDMTPEQRAAHAAQFVGPEALLTDAQRRNTADANKGLALARLAQAKAISDRNFDVALRNATSREEANRLTALKAQNDQTIAQQKHLWETGTFLDLPNIPMPAGQQAQMQPQAVPQAPMQQATPHAQETGFTSPEVPPITVTGNTPEQAKAMFDAARKAAGIQTVGNVAAPSMPQQAPPLATSALSPKAQQDVTTYGQKQTQEAVVRGLRENYDRLKDAPQQLMNIEKSKALVPSARAFQGSLGEQKLAVAKFFNNNLRLRINLEGVQTAEELRSRIFFNVMDNLKKLDAQPSQLQQQIMQDSLGKLGTDPDALGRVLDAFADAIRDKVGIYENQVQEATKAGIQWPHRITLPQPSKPAAVAPSNTVREFATLKDAIAAGVKAGEKVRIGGKVGTIQE